MEDMTTIQISNKTKDRLNELGKMNDTYESVIINLIDDYFESKKLLSESERFKQHVIRQIEQQTEANSKGNLMVLEHALYKDKKKIENEEKV